jgi:hypothetical protein
MDNKEELNQVLHVHRRSDAPENYTGILEYPNRTKEWFKNGNPHREDGPAVECANGTKEWWLNGKLHREDGPAVEYASGHKEWWLDYRFVCNDSLLHYLDNNYIVLERGIPTYVMFGDLKITYVRLLTANGTEEIMENVPGREI